MAEQLTTKQLMYNAALMDLQEQLEIIPAGPNIIEDMIKSITGFKYRGSWIFKDESVFVIFKYMDKTHADEMGAQLSKFLGIPLKEWIEKDCDTFLGIRYEFDFNDVKKIPPISKEMISKLTSITLQSVTEKHNKLIAKYQNMSVAK